ncbi:MAG TPA: zinc ribbon domain-containing protein [Gemmatimonadales bacterium]|nr:zinc ribbon domain-containing protein [Gemmatimonadales bacterium]
MTELERLFRQLVFNLSATDQSRLRAPLVLREIRDSLVPYRANRRAMQIESSEDYELALMALCAGQGGFAALEPESIRLAFAEEIESPNPDLTLLQQHEHVSLTLNSEAVARVVTPPDPHQSFAPPLPVEPEPEAPIRRQRLVQDASRPQAQQCSRCRGSLPTSRSPNFCPHCGFDLRRGYCPQCNAELEPEWRHCVSCGLAVPQR